MKFHSVIFNVHELANQRPGGAYRIASYLREHDWDVEVIEWATLWTLEELQELARSRITQHTVFFGFSTFFAFWSQPMEDYAAWVKKTFPHVKIIIGGQSKPRMESKAVDYYITGFGEKAALALLKSLTGNSEDGPPVTYDLKFFGKKKVITANTYYPSFPMNKLMIKYEDRDFLWPDEWLTMEFARGCIFKCLYCNFPILGVKEDHTRTAEDFREQMMDAYDRFGITNYYVSDETFNDYTAKIVKFADAAETLPFKPFFSGFMRADLLVSRPQDLEHILRLGFLGQFYGIESMNWPSAKAIGKGMNPDKLLPGILDVRKYFKTHGDGIYRANMALMIGLPHETEDTLLKTKRWLIDNWQGETFEAWPLEIPLDYEQDVLSSLSKDWKKWGYRETDLHLRNIPASEGKYAEVKHGISNLNWENDHMTYARAREISVEWRKELRQLDFRINPFGLDRFMQDGDSIHDVLKLKVSETSAVIPGKDAVWKSRVAEYKRKKMDC